MPPDGRDLDETLRRSLEELRWKTAFHQDAWGLGQTERWDTNLETGLITFTSPGLRVSAPMQIVGTYFAPNRSWMWGWNHPSIEPALAQDAERVRDFGDRFGLARYTTTTIACTEDEAWQFTALACHLSGAAGGYRGPMDEDSAIFLTFGDPIIERG